MALLTKNTEQTRISKIYTTEHTNVSTYKSWQNGQNECINQNTTYITGIKRGA